MPQRTSVLIACQRGPVSASIVSSVVYGCPFQDQTRTCTICTHSRMRHTSAHAHSCKFCRREIIQILQYLLRVFPCKAETQSCNGLRRRTCENEKVRGFLESPALHSLYPRGTKFRSAVYYFSSFLACRADSWRRCAFHVNARTRNFLLQRACLMLDYEESCRGLSSSFQTT